jgi:hypothetical protein
VSTSPVLAIVECLEAAGVRFRLDGEKIKAKLPEPVSPEVLQTLETLRARRGEVATLLRQRQKQPLATCGSPDCAGCYEVELGRSIHPPKPSKDWLEWLSRWQKPKGERVQ